MIAGTYMTNSITENVLNRRDLDNIFISIPEMVAVLDIDYTIRMATQSFADALQLQLSAILDEKCYRFLDCFQPDSLKCPHQIAIRQGRTVRIEHSSFHLPFTMELTCVPTYDNQKIVSGSIITLKNIGKRKIAEKNSEKQISFLSSVLDSLTYPLIVVNVDDYSLKMANATALKNGLPECRTCYCLLYGKTRPCSDDGMICPMNEVKEKKQFVILEHTVTPTDGDSRYYEIHAYPIFDDYREVIRVIIYSIDITERKSLDKTIKNRLRIEHGLAKCSEVLLENGVSALSKALEFLLGASSVSQISIYENFIENNDYKMRQTHISSDKSIEGRHRTTTGTAGFSYFPDFQRWFTELRSHRVISGTIDNFHGSEKKYLVKRGIQSLLIIPLFIKNEWVGFIEFDDYYSRRTWTEDDIIILNTAAELIGFYFERKLTDHILRSSREQLQMQNDKLIELNQFKSDLMAITSHDLKSPLGSIIPMAQLLKQTASTMSSEVLVENLDVIISAAHKMKNFIDSMMNLVKIESGTFELTKQPACIANIIQTSLETIRMMATEKKIELLFAVKGIKRNSNLDAMKIEQVFNNILSNAIKFSPKNTTITINLAYHALENEISICDEGPGIAEPYRDRVFDKYFQLDGGVSKETQHGSSSAGLGLYIAKKIVTMHDGEIKVCNKPNGGCCFTIVLPS